MDNATFKLLVSALEKSPEALHSFLCGDCNHADLARNLDERTRTINASLSPAQRLDLALTRQIHEAEAARDAISQCAASCGPTSVAMPMSCDLSLDGDHCSGQCYVTCSCGSSTGLVAEHGGFSGSPGVVHIAGDTNSLRHLPIVCGPDTTCCCTSNTCGGVTCGGSTCAGTCSGDSCGNTCGDSCGSTSGFPAGRWTSWLMQEQIVWGQIWR